MLDHVLRACRKAAAHTRGVHSDRSCRVVLLTPTGDQLAKDFGNYWTTLEGPEHDVLSRYHLLLNAFGPEVIVRVTADCVLIPPYIISKHIDLALKNGYDYVANVDERWRTAIDGVDCEVFTPRMLQWAHEIATLPEDREHVTTIMRKCPPDWAKIGSTVGFFDMSHIKFSVDTQEDLDRVRTAYDAAQQKFGAAVNKLGSDKVHRL